MIGHKNLWRTLAAGGAVKTFPNREKAETYARKKANLTNDWVGIEEWSTKHPQDEANEGWALVATVQPDSRS